MPTGEQWRAVVGFEGRYEVSDHGRVRSLTRQIWCPASSRTKGYWRVGEGIVLKQSLRGGSNGATYRTVCLGRDAMNQSVAHLVLGAFAGPRPTGHVARHLNDMPADNRLVNLAWGTAKQNRADSLRNDTFARNNLAKWHHDKTHCPHGHPYSGDNLYVNPTTGARSCRRCGRAKSARYSAKKRAAES